MGTLCKCGCGEEINQSVYWKNGKKVFIKYKHGHNQRGVKISDEHKIALRNSLIGHKSYHTKKSKNKISESLKGRNKPPRSKEHCDALSKSLSGRVAWNKDKKMKQHMNNETYNEYVEKMRKNGIKGRLSCSVGDTKIEKKMENFLIYNSVLYVKQHKYKLGIADFWLPEYNVIIECDGDYWHSLPRIVKRNKIQNKWLESNDYIVLRFTETQINKDWEFVRTSINDVLR